jgi:hypothetical protein
MMDQSARPEVVAGKKKKNATGVPSALPKMAAEAKKKKTETGCPSGTPETREMQQ